MVGPAVTAYQVMKKTQEALRLPPERGVQELLGAINYAAATILIIRENALATTVVNGSISDHAVVQAPSESFEARLFGGGA